MSVEVKHATGLCWPATLVDPLPWRPAVLPREIPHPVIRASPGIRAETLMWSPFSMLVTKTRKPAISRPLFLCEKGKKGNKIKIAQLTQKNHWGAGKEERDVGK